MILKDQRVFKATWYKDSDTVNKTVAIEFFSNYNEYTDEEIDEVDQLQVGQSANFSDCANDHFVRRIK